MSDVNVDAGLTVDSSVSDVVTSSGLSGSDSSNTLPEIGTDGRIDGRKPTVDEIFNTPIKNKVVEKPVEKVVEAPVVEDVVDEPVVEDPAKVEEPVVENEGDDDLVVEEDLSVSKINQYIKSIPELQQAFNKHPDVRNAVYAMARRSTKLGEYQTILPTPDAAKFAAQNSEQFVQMNELFFSENPVDVTNFWNSLYENSLTRDPQTGEILRDQNGRVIPTGAYERVAGTYRNAVYTELSNKALQLPEEQKNELLKAIEVVKEHAGDGRRVSPDEPKLTPEQQKRLDDADKVLKTSSTQQEQYRHDFRVSTQQVIGTTITQDIETHVKRMVTQQNLALTPYEQKKVVGDIFDKINKSAGESVQYQQHFESLANRAPLTEAGKLSLVAEARKYAKELLPSAALAIIREATSKTVENTVSKNAKRVDQASRKEVKASGSASIPVDDSKLDTKAKAKVLSQKLGRPLTVEEIMDL
jgi:hypothetical protein